MPANLPCCQGTEAREVCGGDREHSGHAFHHTYIPKHRFEPLSLHHCDWETVSIVMQCGRLIQPRCWVWSGTPAWRTPLCTNRGHSAGVERRKPRKAIHKSARLEVCQATSCTCISQGATSTAHSEENPSVAPFAARRWHSPSCRGNGGGWSLMEMDGGGWWGWSGLKWV